MTEKSFEKIEFKFPASKDYQGVSYVLGELTPTGTALYMAAKNPQTKEDWPTCIEVNQKGDVVWDNLNR